MTLKVDNIQNENASEANVVLNTNGSISIPSQIKHVGDPDTLIEFETDTVKLQTGGTARVTVANTTTTVQNKLISSNAIQAGGDGNNGTAAGIVLNNNGVIHLTHASSGSEVFHTFAEGSNTSNCNIKANGHATFNGVTLSDGNLVVANGHGIDFSNQTATSATGATTDSELLDHYEEGTWTPVPRFGGTSHILTGSFNGNYTRIGDKVEARFRITFTAKGTSTGAFTVEGLPFATDDSLLWTNSGFGFLHRTNLPQTAGQVTADVSGAVINFRLLGQNGGNTTAMDDADLVNTSDIRGSVCYKVAS